MHDERPWEVKTRAQFQMWTNETAHAHVLALEISGDGVARSAPAHVREYLVNGAESPMKSNRCRTRAASWRSARAGDTISRGAAGLRQRTSLPLLARFR
jgi:hypothetical protein